MNTLELRIEATDTEYGPEVRVLIDGRDLVDLARAAEASSAAATGQPELAGGYRGLHPTWWRDLPEQDDDGKAAVLGCECGEPGCWPLRVRIRVGADTVSWSDFEQPHGPAWTHDSLGPYVFNREAYDASIAAVTAHTS